MSHSDEGQLMGQMTYQLTFLTHLFGWKASWWIILMKVSWWVKWPISWPSPHIFLGRSGDGSFTLRMTRVSWWVIHPFCGKTQLMGQWYIIKDIETHSWWVIDTCGWPIDVICNSDYFSCKKLGTCKKEQQKYLNLSSPDILIILAASSGLSCDFVVIL